MIHGAGCSNQIPSNHDPNEILKTNHMSYLDFNTPMTQIPGNNCSWDLKFTPGQVAKMISESGPWASGNPCNTTTPIIPGGDYTQNIIFDQPEYDIYKDLFISGNVEFHNTKLNIGPGVTLHVLNGGRLLLDETVVESLCDSWLGIDAVGSGSTLAVYGSTINDAAEGIRISSNALFNMTYTLVNNCGTAGIPGLSLNAAKTNILNNNGFRNSNISLSDNPDLAFTGIKCKNSSIVSNNTSLIIMPGGEIVSEFDESNITFTGSSQNLTVDDTYFHSSVNKPIIVNSCNDLVICRNWFDGSEESAMNISSTSKYMIFHNLVDGVSGDAVLMTGASGSKSLIQNNVFDGNDSNDLDLEDDEVDVTCNFHDNTDLPWNLHSGSFAQQGNEGHPAGNVFDNSTDDIEYEGTQFDYYHSSASMEIPELASGTDIQLLPSDEPKSACSPKSVIRGNWGKWVRCNNWWETWRECGDIVKEDCIPDPINEGECLKLKPPTFVNSGLTSGGDPDNGRAFQDNNQAFSQNMTHTQYSTQPITNSDSPLESRSTSAVSYNRFYPNPITNELIISSSNPDLHTYRLLNPLGKLVLNGEFSMDTHILDTSGLSDGIYIAQLINEEGEVVITKKIIKI